MLRKLRDAIRRWLLVESLELEVNLLADASARHLMELGKVKARTDALERPKVAINIEKPEPVRKTPRISDNHLG